MLELLFRLGEFCYCFLTAPLESAFGNAPLLVLLYEPRRLTVKALDIRRKGGVILPRLFLCLTGTGEQRLDVIFLTGIFGSFARDVGPQAYPVPAPTTPPTPAPMAAPCPHQRARLPQPLRRPLLPVPTAVLSTVVRWVSERPAQPASSPVTSIILAVFRIIPYPQSTIELLLVLSWASVMVYRQLATAT